MDGGRAEGDIKLGRPQGGMYVSDKDQSAGAVDNILLVSTWMHHARRLIPDHRETWSLAAAGWCLFSLESGEPPLSADLSTGYPTKGCGEDD